MSARSVRFDDALPLLAGEIASTVGAEALASGVVLRDATGRLAFFSRAEIEPAAAEGLEARLRAALGHYARPDRVLVDPRAPGAEEVLAEAPAAQVAGEHSIRLLDRRIVGADWLRSPAPAAEGARRFVFASLKGGVGRSTALAVAAADLARQGRSVLVVDLDLEAPGLGSLLLGANTLPEFGTLDYLVENKVEVPDDGFLADLIGPSGVPAGGRIDVAPAFGRRSLAHPGDVLAKIGRAYVETARPEGALATMFDQIRELVDRLAGRARYDAVLIDARAGLHETTAASVLGLGADVFLFALDEPQSFDGYSTLLATLARLAPPTGPLPEWVERLTPVQAKAPAEAERRREFDQRWQDLVLRVGPSRRPPAADGDEVRIPEGFTDVPWDESAPDEEVVPVDSPLMQPIAVLSDARYVAFDPLRRRELVDDKVYSATFGDLLRRVNAAIEAEHEEAP
jgi:cellulose biosynthesis protein BcsQ